HCGSPLLVRFAARFSLAFRLPALQLPLAGCRGRGFTGADRPEEPRGDGAGLRFSLSLVGAARGRRNSATGVGVGVVPERRARPGASHGAARGHGGAGGQRGGAERGRAELPPPTSPCVRAGRRRRKLLFFFFKASNYFSAESAADGGHGPGLRRGQRGDAPAALRPPLAPGPASSSPSPRPPPSPLPPLLPLPAPLRAPHEPPRSAAAPPRRRAPPAGSPLPQRPGQAAPAAARRPRRGGSGRQVPAPGRVSRRNPGLPERPRLALRARLARSRRRSGGECGHGGAQPHRLVPAAAAGRARAGVPSAQRQLRPGAPLQGERRAVRARRGLRGDERLRGGSCFPSVWLVLPVVRAERTAEPRGGSRCRSRARWRSSIPGIVCKESLDAIPLPTPSRTNVVLVSFVQVFPLKHYQDKIRPYVQLPSHCNITGVVEVILGDTKAYVFFEKDFGDMHSYVRSCKRLREEEAARLFRQIVAAVAHCHQSAIVLGDLKLRKFVFSNEERTQLRLESLEDTHIIKGEDDALSDKHGCPAYVSPEILNTTGTYSGKSADVWSLGVMLYTLLVGRYPFHDSDPSTLFSKIRRGQFCIPDHVSPKARCLIRSLLRREPSERLTAPEILLHPWFEAVLEPGYTDQETGTSDQIVPEYHGDNDDISSFFC
uniref:Tribbles pseudokinase 1 n=5 Tax=Aves TaxID=8782 RepID=A0A8C2T074_COTJA